MSYSRSKARLSLNYARSNGVLGPYFKALTRGQAMASVCPVCRKTWFPPHAVCPEDGGVCETVLLSGRGTIVCATQTKTTLPFTTGPALTTFALVEMDGADTAALGRVSEPDGSNLSGRRVRLSRNPGPIGHPAQALVFDLE